jgi:hypothetical protein
MTDQEPTHPVWVPIEAVAPMLGCTVEHARWRARNGVLPGAAKLPDSRRWLVDLRVLDAALTAHRLTP